MGPAIYMLSAATNLLCFAMLISSYRRSGSRLLLWSGLCFAGLTMTNVLVFVDLVVVPAMDLYLLRIGVAIIAMAMLMFWLIWGER